MKVKDVMSRPITTATPETSLQAAARTMRDLDIGFLPVIREGKLLGIITDRDIACRAVAQGEEPAATPIAHAMSRGVITCFEDQDLKEVAALMAQKQIHRLVVLDRASQPAGVLSICDLALRAAHELTGELVEAVSRNPRRSAAFASRQGTSTTGA